MPIYLPKQIIPLKPTLKSPLLFFGGPIRGGGDWQSEMAHRAIQMVPSVQIACPSRWDSTHPLAHHFYQPFSRANNRQLVWERHYLKQAGLEAGASGCIIFWLCRESAAHPHPGPEPYAMDTRRELGKFTAFAELMNVRMVVGGDRDFYGLDVILFELCEAYRRPFPFYDRMEDAIVNALRIARE